MGRDTVGFCPVRQGEDRDLLDTGTDGFVVFDRVQKSYDGETLVVKDLNLAIGKGEFLTMLGPSGSGKTTCLMMLAGFETATHGDIRLDGRPINDIPPHKRGIGMVFQNYALFPHMSVAENLAFPLEVRKIGKERARAQGRPRARDGADGRLRRPPPGAALGRPAAAGGAGPGAGVRARARADGRAARRARQAAARAHAVRDHPPRPRPRHHRGLRHPRPDRGADHVGPGRGVRRRPHPAARDPRRALREADEQLRRPLHRREQHADRHSRRDRAAAPRSCASTTAS